MERTLSKGEILMQFREEQVDKIKVVDSCGPEELIEQLNELAQDHIFIDIQYSTCWANQYSALVLLRKKQ